MCSSWISSNAGQVQLSVTSRQKSSFFCVKKQRISSSEVSSNAGQVQVLVMSRQKSPFLSEVSSNAGQVQLLSHVLAKISLFLCQKATDKFKWDKFKCLTSSSVRHVLAKISLFLCQKAVDKFKSDEFKYRISASICFGPTGSPCRISSIFSHHFFFSPQRWPISFLWCCLLHLRSHKLCFCWTAVDMWHLPVCMCVCVRVRACMHACVHVCVDQYNSVGYKEIWSYQARKFSLFQ